MRRPKSCPGPSTINGFKTGYQPGWVPFTPVWLRLGNASRILLISQHRSDGIHTMDLLTQGTNLVIERLKTDLQTGIVKEALGEALAAVNMDDLHRTLSQNRQTQHQISAWLGADDHHWLAIDQVESILGADQVKVFAGRLGIDQATAATVLADMLAMLTPEQVES